MKISAAHRKPETHLVVMFVLFLFSNNPIFGLMGIPIIPIFLFFSMGLALERGIPALRHKAVLVLVAGYLSTAAVTALHHQTHVPFVFAFLSAVYFLTTTSLTRIEILAITELSTKVLFWTSLLAAISLIFSIVYPLPILKIGTLELHYFSLMYPNTPFVRPAGFMHEPGQLSFYLCIVVSAREFLQLDRQRSILILILGLITQSLAHMLFFAAYISYISLTFQSDKNRHRTLAIAIALLLPVLASGLLSWAVQRATTFYDSPEEWGRFLSLNNVLNVMDDRPGNYVFGPTTSLASRTLEAEDAFSPEHEGVSIYGENPLSPLVFGGLLASWPYYLFISAPLLFFSRRIRTNALLLMCALLTLQRPYTLEFPYTLAIALVIYCARIEHLESIE